MYLFGKTYSEKAKNFVSCCVAVRDIDRRLFVLPKAQVISETRNSINFLNYWCFRKMKQIQK